jgi:hypothetical protein
MSSLGKFRHISRRFSSIFSEESERPRSAHRPLTLLKGLFRPASSRNLAAWFRTSCCFSAGSARTASRIACSRDINDLDPIIRRAAGDAKSTALPSHPVFSHNSVQAVRVPDLSSRPNRRKNVDLAIERTVPTGLRASIRSSWLSEQEVPGQLLRCHERRMYSSASHVVEAVDETHLPCNGPSNSDKRSQKPPSLDRRPATHATKKTFSNCGGTCSP